jgi:hypothetical protein
MQAARALQSGDSTAGIAVITVTEMLSAELIDEAG